MPDTDPSDLMRRGTSTTHGSREDVSLYEYFEQRLRATEEQTKERLHALDERLSASIESQRDITQVRFDASQAAIKKADDGAEKRFESVNEFRGQLTDQASTFVTREALESALRESAIARSALEKAVNELSTRLSNVEGRMIAYTGSVGLVVTILSALFATIGHIWK